MWSSTSPPTPNLAKLRLYTHTWFSCLRLFSVFLLNCFHDYHLTLYAKQLIRKQSSVLIECSLKVMCVRGLVLVLLPPAAQLQVTLTSRRASPGELVCFSPQGLWGLMLFCYGFGKSGYGVLQVHLHDEMSLTSDKEQVRIGSLFIRISLNVI